jgi:hypothetical protein
MSPAVDDREAWRHNPWGGADGDEDWVFIGEDLHDGTFAMQVRGAPGEVSAALVTLVNAAAGSQGLSAVYDATFPDPDTGEIVGGTILTPLITKTTLEGLSWGQCDPARALPLAYDLQVTPAGGARKLRVRGAFVLNPGVTL